MRNFPGNVLKRIPTPPTGRGEKTRGTRAKRRAKKEGGSTWAQNMRSNILGALGSTQRALASKLATEGKGGEAVKRRFFRGEGKNCSRSRETRVVISDPGDSVRELN